MENLFEENGLIYSDETKKVIVGVAENLEEVTELVIPEGVEEIRGGSMQILENLKKLVLPSSLKAMGPNSNVTKECEIKSTFYKSLDLYPYDWFEFYGVIPVRKLILKQESTIGIGYDAFKGWNTLEEVIAEEDIENVEDGAFAGCTNLKSVVFKGRVGYIGERAFAGCDNLEEINIPAETEVNENAFDGKNTWRNKWVDLGLPSGTLWARSNLGADNIPDSAGEKVMSADKFKKASSLPTIKQMMELRWKCVWDYKEELSAYKVMGQNGENILLPFPKEELGKAFFAIYNCFEDELPILSADGTRIIGTTMTPKVKRYIREVNRIE